VLGVPWSWTTSGLLARYLGGGEVITNLVRDWDSKTTGRTLRVVRQICLMSGSSMPTLCVFGWEDVVDQIVIKTGESFPDDVSAPVGIP
jgi:hypothetical protein